jgi:hypothetical protein
MRDETSEAIDIEALAQFKKLNAVSSDSYVAKDELTARGEKTIEALRSELSILVLWITGMRATCMHCHIVSQHMLVYTLARLLTLFLSVQLTHISCHRWRWKGI